MSSLGTLNYSPGSLIRPSEHRVLLARRFACSAIPPPPRQPLWPMFTKGRAKGWGGLEAGAGGGVGRKDRRDGGPGDPQRSRSGSSPSPSLPALFTFHPSRPFP